MTTVAGIDCGTNSIRLLIANADMALQQLEALYADNIIVRLGQGVDKTGKLADEAIERTFDALDQYAEKIKEYGVEKVRFVATSASRDASNRDVFVAGVKERLGIEPEVISGDEEAELAFTGAMLGLSANAQAPYLLTDLGGGSTELVLGNQEEVVGSFSMNIGCVRITERCLKSDPPTEEEINAGLEVINEAIDQASFDVEIGKARTFIGVAGTITTVAAYTLGLKEYDSSKIHGAELRFADAKQSCQEIITMSREERSQLGIISPGRVDVVGAGALVFKTLMERIEEETQGKVSRIIISETDILHGITLSCALD